MKKASWNKAKSTKFMSPTLSRKHILEKYVFDALGDVAGKRLVEFGSGNGFWLRKFASRGAKCTGVDIAKEQVTLAEADNERGITYVVGDAATFTTKAPFDIVYIDHVISETSSRKKVEKILMSARNALKKNGRLILSEMHPSVLHFPFDGISAATDYNYFKSGAAVTCTVKQADGTSVTLTDYHWTVEDFISLLASAGFVVERIIEPRASKASKDAYVALRSKYPSHIIIVATKR